MSIPGRISWRWATAGLLLALLVVTSLASAASAGAVRECVQRNLPRYTNPGSAVVAQYADVETTCRAALDDGSVSVEFDPGGGASSGTGGRSSGGAATGGGAAEPATPAPRTGASPAPAAPTPKPTPSRSRPRPSGGTTTQPAPDDSAKIVAQAIAQAGTGGAGSPLPSSLSEGSAWRYILVGGAVLLVVVAGGLAVRRRLN